MNSIGLVECKNVSKGILVTDEMLKSAGITLLSSGAVCPGKYVTIVGGELSAIKASVDHAAVIAEDALIESFVIGNLAKNVFEAVHGAVSVENKRSLGIIETFTAASAIKAADAAVKSGYIELIDKTRIPLEYIPKKHTYFNRMVQGSGAIILKKVVSEIVKQLPEGASICFLLHDELMIEAPTHLTQVCVRIVTKTMTEVLYGYGYNIDLPISIEIKRGGE